MTSFISHSHQSSAIVKIALLRLILLMACFATTAAAQTRPFKVLVSVDMEGTTGVVTAEQLGPPGFEYARFREFMTAEALAAVEAVRESGAGEIVVVDGHGNRQNLLIERFPAEVRLIRSCPLPLPDLFLCDSGWAPSMRRHSAWRSTSEVWPAKPALSIPSPPLPL